MQTKREKQQQQNKGSSKKKIRLPLIYLKNNKNRNKQQCGVRKTMAMNEKRKWLPDTGEPNDVTNERNNGDNNTNINMSDAMWRGKVYIVKMFIVWMRQMAEDKKHVEMRFDESVVTVTTFTNCIEFEKSRRMQWNFKKM